MDQLTKSDAKPVIERWRRLAMIVAGAGVVAGLGVFAFSRDAFFQGYIFAYMFWFSFALGSLAALMLHHMVGGGWGFMIQRMLEAGAKTLPLMALLFIPIVLGMSHLYPWMNPALVSGGHLEEILIERKSEYLNFSFWLGRAVFYFAVWIGMAYLLTSWSKNLDETGNLQNINRYRKLSPFGIIFFFLSLTFAATDWVKSLEPEWFSTMYGAIFVVGQGLCVLSFGIILLSVLHKHAPLNRVFSIEFYHHIGTLLCAFVVLWAYTNFGQYLIIWSGNLPEESVWYVNRTSGFLVFIAVGLMIFHFGVPLLVLLQRRVKTNITGLRNVAIGILVMRVIDLLWVIKPSFKAGSLGMVPVDLLLLAGLGGIWLWFFFGNLLKLPLVVQNDPRMNEAIAKLPLHEHDEDEDVSAHA